MKLSTKITKCMIKTDKWSILFYFSDLLRNIRTQVLIKLINPYTRIQIPFISKVSNLFVLYFIKLWLKKSLQFVTISPTEMTTMILYIWDNITYLKVTEWWPFIFVRHFLKILLPNFSVCSFTTEICNKKKFWEDIRSKKDSSTLTISI